MSTSQWEWEEMRKLHDDTVKATHDVVGGKGLPNMKDEKMSVTFAKDKETKNTIRFTSPIGNDISGSIYVQKDSDLAKETEIVLEIAEKAEVSA